MFRRDFVKLTAAAAPSALTLTYNPAECPPLPKDLTVRTHLGYDISKPRDILVALKPDVKASIVRSRPKVQFSVISLEGDRLKVFRAKAVPQDCERPATPWSWAIKFQIEKPCHYVGLLVEYPELKDYCVAYFTPAMVFDPAPYGGSVNVTINYNIHDD